MLLQYLLIWFLFSYQNNYTDTHELDSSYFRRQPASILSTGKSSEPDLGGRYSWIGQSAQMNNNSDYQTETRYESYKILQPQAPAQSNCKMLCQTVGRDHA